MSDTSTTLYHADLNRQSRLADSRLAAIEKCRPTLMIACLIASDLLSLAIAWTLAIFVKLVPLQLGALHPYFPLIPLLLIFPVVYSALGLYSGISLGSPEELRRLTLSSFLIYVFLGLLTLSVRGNHILFTWSMGVALMLTLILLPLARAILRLRLSKVSWWGYPTVVFGNEDSAEPIIRNFVDNTGLGLKPVGFFSLSQNQRSKVSGVPAIGLHELALWAPRIKGHAFAVLAAPASAHEDLMVVIDSYRQYFSHILIVPEFSGFPCLWVSPKNLGGLLGLEICQQVFIPRQQILKRAIDLLLTLSLSVMIVPLVLLIAIAVRIDSPGPMFYPQRRIGRGGREFFAWKFRSMVPNADVVLKSYLAGNPDLQEEWLRSHKLKNDPRITRLGNFLRRSSLDELPQLWNVLRGEMSLVGPRPIVREEIPRYGSDFKTYTYVPGGLTGLWQVSGRSDTSYQQRVELDRFYVHNWSLWLDFCILFRTVGIVLSRSGAC